jgi:catechol 2,3-dioxygenase-like lactoylglutathione lyase family enzyme
MPSRFDHAVVIVPSLKRAVRSFERLGFRVVPGGRTGPVHNALILFSDGTYIELTTNRFSMARPVYRALNAAGLMGSVAAKRKDMLHRFLPWIGARQGAIDWCIRVDDIRDAVCRLRDAGVEMVDETEFDRERPDGQVARWLLAGPRDVRLPFLIEDLTPVEIRVPFRDLSTHPNGVTGIRRLVLPHEAKAAFERALGRVLRAEPGSMTDESAPLGSATVGTSRQEEIPKEPYRLELLRPGGNDEDLDPNETFDASIKIVGT